MVEDQILKHALERLEWSTRALYQPVDIQRTLYPDFVVVADELALDFDQWLSVATSHGCFVPARLEPLLAINRKLGHMSGTHNARLWTLDALANSPEWSSIRALAGDALKDLGWPTAPPPPSPDSFIQS